MPRLPELHSAGVGSAGCTAAALCPGAALPKATRTHRLPVPLPKRGPYSGQSHQLMFSASFT